MTATKTLVRCCNKYVFEVNSITLEPKSCSYYDPYCYINPDPNCKYIDEPDYIRMKKQNENNRND